MSVAYKSRKLARRLPQEFLRDAIWREKSNIAIDRRENDAMHEAIWQTTKSQTISALHLVEREAQKHWTWCSLKTSRIDYSSRLCNETFCPCVEFQNFVAKPFNAFECDRISHNFFAVTWSHVNADLHYKTDGLQNEKCKNFHGKIERTSLSGWVTTRHCNDQTIPAINHRKVLSLTRSEKFWRKQNSRERNKFINHDDIASVFVRVLRNQTKIEVNSKSI